MEFLLFVLNMEYIVNDSIKLNTDKESNVSINKFNLNSLLATILSMADVPYHFKLHSRDSCFKLHF